MYVDVHMYIYGAVKSSMSAVGIMTSEAQKLPSSFADEADREIIQRRVEERRYYCCC